MIDRLERLINLVIALRETRRPLPADEIRRRVAGYGQDEYEAFRRMFERDKADLRSLGVPIEAVHGELGDAVEGYRIVPSSYDLPPVGFEGDELAALALAVEATGLTDLAATALRKLDVGRPPTDAAPPLPTAGGRTPLEVPLEQPHRSLLTEAQLTRTRVRFSYRRADGTASQRTVEPHGMVFRRGHWYLVGHDRERGAVRSFRLDRIEGRVRTVGRAGAFDAPAEPLDVDSVVPETSRVTAVVAVTDELAWRVARRARGEGRRLPDGRTAYEVTGDADAVVRWMIEEGPDVEVVAPEELRDRVRAHLDGVLARVSAGGRP